MPGTANPGTNTTDECYLLYQTDNANEGENAFLFSSCYKPNDQLNRDISLRFNHFIYGSDVGSLSVYLRPGCERAQDWPTSQAPRNNELIRVVEAQSDRWSVVQIPLNTAPSSAFQILFEAVVGSGLGYIALDKISINGVTCFVDTDFFCDNSSCILDDWVCDKHDQDGLVDCIDGTDEAEATCNCDTLVKFQCNNGRCIDKTQLCDGVNDCTRRESEDEAEMNCQGGSSTITPSTISNSQISGSVTGINETTSDVTNPLVTIKGLAPIIGGVIAACFLILLAIVIWKRVRTSKDTTNTDRQHLDTKRKSDVNPEYEDHLEQPYINAMEMYPKESHKVSADVAPPQNDVIYDSTPEMDTPITYDEMYSLPPEFEVGKTEHKEENTYANTYSYDYSE
ncbi:uncharacterized protein [Amphiura filiformis]